MSENALALREQILALAEQFFNRNQTAVRTIDLQMSFSF